MKNFLTVFVLVSSLTSSLTMYAQGPRGKTFGFGLVLGEPLGGTVKYWFDRETALNADIGGSWYGSPRLDVDYLWHFDAFNSQVVKMYAGPGLVLGFGEYGNGWWRKNGYYYRDRYGRGEVSIALRGTFGINVIPRRTPLEIFLGIGPLISVSPGFFSGFDLAFGVRFYP